ncbi:DUF6188 family protein [Humibacillus sp. DSM 29435]|uniref:DUF6188 family protein n=1 Tax=Humibacillus sp. DSM 29435 TaxID=1869167 RepID=UPI00111311B7|nr:DUF6188 family protein [Humibacillus sp. DSM 29435]
MTPDLRDQTIDSARLGYMLRLFTSGDWQIDIETDVVATRSNADPTPIRMNVPDAELPEHLAWLLGSTITEVAVADNGDLTIVLDTGRLTAEALSDYEAWQMYGPRGEIVVCGPGGRFTEWGPRHG